MDEMVYNALSSYYNALDKKGYMPWGNVIKLLVLLFYWEFVYHDYRCHLNRADYRLIEEALNCLYGTTCLIPYPDYLKMGKLHLGDMAELACRVKNLEDTNVVKVIHDLQSAENADAQSDVIIMADE
jgi:hypothetical protein